MFDDNEYTKRVLKQLQNVKFSGNFRPECEGEPSPSKDFPDYLVSDPQKAIEKINSFDISCLDATAFRDGGSLQVSTPEETFVLLISNDYRTYRPYALRKVK